MRIDARIDKRKVRCPNVPQTGTSKPFAQVGDIVEFESFGRPRIGRMVGRIAYAPRCGETPELHDYLLVATLGERLTHIAERWVNPSDVTDVHTVENQAEVVASLFAPTFTRYPLDDIRHALSGLWSTMENFVTWRRSTR